MYAVEFTVKHLTVDITDFRCFFLRFYVAPARDPFAHYGTSVHVLPIKKVAHYKWPDGQDVVLLVSLRHVQCV
jgi:hypothetical protein